VNYKFVAQKVVFLVNSCQTCAHRFPTDAGRCDAFPGGIPGEILDGLNLHRELYPGDRGIRYEPVVRPTVAL
jgi:hypothetical protein